MFAPAAPARQKAAPARNNLCTRYKGSAMPRSARPLGTGAPPCLDPQGSLVQGVPPCTRRLAPAAAPASNDACKQHVLGLHRRLLLPTPMDARGMCSLLADGSSCQQQWLHSTAAAPASNPACKRHALRPRRRQHQPASMEADGMRRSRASGRSCQQTSLQAACAVSAPAAAPARNPACERNVLRPRRRQLLPTTLDARGMRLFRADSSTCRQQCLHAACTEA